jgi:hypothetical protein
MQKIKDVLRLYWVGGIESRRQIARAVGCGKSAVSDCLRRARLAGLSAWAQIAELDEVELSRQLYRSAGGSTPKRAPARPLPDWARVREELARRDHQVVSAWARHLDSGSTYPAVESQQPRHQSCAYSLVFAVGQRHVVDCV